MDYKEFGKMKSEQDNLFPIGTDPQEAIDILGASLCENYRCSYLTSYPVSVSQMNTEIVCDILYRLRRKTFLEKLCDLIR